MSSSKEFILGAMVSCDDSDIAKKCVHDLDIVWISKYSCEFVRRRSKDTFLLSTGYGRVLDGAERHPYLSKLVYALIGS